MSDILFCGYHPLIPLADKRKADPNGLSSHRNTDFLLLSCYSISILKPILNMYRMMTMAMRAILQLFCNGVKGKIKGNGHIS